MGSLRWKLAGQDHLPGHHPAPARGDARFTMLALMERGQLDGKRVQGVVQRLAQAEGTARAMAVGKRAAHHTQAPALIDIVITQSDVSGDEARAPLAG